MKLGSKPTHTGTGYPSPFDVPVRERRHWRLADLAGLKHFGVNVLELPPGVWSSQRHWHTEEEEFVWILEGEVVLVMNEGEHILRAGEYAAFPAGEPNGHHLQNRTQSIVRVLEIGTKRDGRDTATYPDIDLLLNEQNEFTHKDGRKY